MQTGCCEQGGGFSLKINDFWLHALGVLLWLGIQIERDCYSRDKRWSKLNFEIVLFKLWLWLELGASGTHYMHTDFAMAYIQLLFYTHPCKQSFRGDSPGSMLTNQVSTIGWLTNGR